VGVMEMRNVYSSLVGKSLEEYYLEDYEHLVKNSGTVPSSYCDCFLPQVLKLYVESYHIYVKETFFSSSCGYDCSSNWMSW
jgi:hypothetical protein